MSKNILLGVLLLYSCFVFAEEECPSAVDAAEAQNHNLYKNCDYSKSGLNGVLHRALTNKSEPDEESKDETKQQKETKGEPAKVIDKKNQKMVDKVEPLKEGEFSSAQQLQSVKFALLEKLTFECAKGFVVEGERYLPVLNSKTMKLELIYHCL